MKTLLSRWLCVGIVVVAVLALISIGCGGGGGGGGGGEAIKTRTLTGTVLAPVSPPASLLAAAAGSPVANAKVWLEGYNDISPQFTDASGTYTFVGVPAAELFVVASINQYGKVYKQRTRVLIQKADVNITAPALGMEEASVILTGVLKDSTGKFLPAGTEMMLWGEVFTVGSNGSFTTPPLPASLNQAEIFVKLPGATAFTGFHGPFVGGSTPAFVEQTVLPPDSGNHAPSGALIAKNTAGIETVKCVTSEQLNFSLTPYDPDTGHRERLTYVWTASRGTLQVTGNQTTATWLAMDSYGLATISVAITDPEGVTGKISLRMLVNIQSIDETDTTAPTVVSRTPVANTVGVTPETSISVAFSEELLASSVTAGAIAVVGQNSAVSGVATLQADKKTIIWSPSPSLPGNQTITVSLAPTISDLYGNQLGEQNSWTFTTALVPNVTVNSLHTNDTTPEISGTVDDPDTTVQVTVNAQNYSAVLAGTSWKVQLTTALGDGIYDIKAVATNKSGVTGSDNTSNELTVDTGPKTAVLSGLPSAVTSSNQTSIIVGGTGVISYLYRHRRIGDVWPEWSAVKTVSEKITLTGLTDGIHNLQVRALDVAGNVQSEENATVYEWTIDTTVKTAQFDVNTLPLNPTNQTTANVIVGGDNVTFYRFRLNTGSWSVTYPVTTPISLVGLKSGTNVINVLGGDGYGNWQPIESPTAFTWVVDAAVKVAVLSNRPANPTNDNSASIVVGGEGVTKYKYSTDGGTTWSAEILISVNDRITMNALADGAYSVKVVGGDNLATWQSTTNATTWAWTIDTAVPTVTLSTTVSSPTNITPIPVRIEFSEPVKDFVSGKITVTNGVTSSLQTIVAGKTWVVNISPDGNGVVSVDIAGAAVTDAAGNDNTAANQLSFSYDSANPTATLTQSGADPANSSPIVVTIKFSKSVSGFVMADLLVGNGSASNLQETLASTTWSVDITPAGQDEVTVDLAANKAFDNAGNGNSVANHLSFTYDSIRPTVALSTSAPNPTKFSPIPVVVTFSEEVNNFILSDIVVGNGNAGNLQVVTAGTAWSVDITPAGQGEVTVDIAENIAVDNANNSNTVALQLKIGYDSVKPTAVLATTAGGMTNVSPIPFTIDFSENVQSFLLSQLTIINGTASNLQVVNAGKSWQFDVVPGGNGNVSVSLAADKVTDFSDNGNTVVAPVVVAYDSKRPAATLSTSVGSSVNTPLIKVFVEFSKDVTGFDTSLLVISNGSSGGLIEETASRKWSFVITPLAQGAVTINLPASKVFDSANNGNTAANQIKVVYDSVSPSVTFTSTAPIVTNLGSIPVTVTFNEVVAGFDLNSLSITNGIPGNLKLITTGRVWTFAVSPLGQGAVSVDMGADVVTDAAGNGNLAAPQLSRVYDTNRPTVQITTVRTSPTSLSPIPITVTFNEDVTSFALSDLTVPNGTAVDLLVAIPNRAWTVNIVPATDGVVSVDLHAGKITDIAGNTNTAAVSLSLDYETSKPTAVITSTITGPTNADPFKVTVTFNENVSSFVAGNLTVTNGTESNEQNIIPNRKWEVDISPTLDGQVDIDLPAGQVFDTAGNGNTAATCLSIVSDRTKPTVTLSSTAVSPTNVSPIPVKIAFSEVVTSFDLSDLVITNGDAGNLQADLTSGNIDKIWTADIFPSSNNTVVQINLAANQATDAAGNGNIAAATLSRTYNSDRPTVAFSSLTTNPTSSNPIPVTITFSKNVFNFVQSDLTVSNGILQTLTAVTGTSVWSVEIVPSGQGLVTLNMAANMVDDGGGNNNTAAAQFSRTYDSVKPAVALSTTSPSPTNNGVIPVTITFDKNVTDFDLGDLTLVNGITNNLEVVTAGRSWTFDLTAGEGASSVTLAADKVHDAAGNLNTAGKLVSVVYDSIHPTAILATTAPEPTNTSIPVTVTFSEPVTGFALADLTIGNGSASNLQVVGTDGKIWSFTVTAAGNGLVTVGLAADAAIDAAGNGNTVAATISRTYDSGKPGVTLATGTIGLTSPTRISPILVNITFTEAVTGFDAGDLVPGNCTISGFAGGGQNYSVNITPTADGPVTLGLPADRAVDSANNGNTAATQLSLVYDTTAPTVVLTTATTSPTNASSFLVTITFNENVTGLVASDIGVVNGTPGTLQVVTAGRVWRMYVTPTAHGAVTVDLPAGRADDTAGNGNAAATQLSVDYDIVKPKVIAIETAIVSPTATSPIPMTITFDESVTGFVLADFSVGNGTVTGLTNVTPGFKWSFNLNPSANGVVTLDLAANKVIDAAGNGNDAAAQFSIVYDNAKPTVALSTTEVSPTKAKPFSVKVTFNEAVSGFVLTDVSVSNGVASNLVADLTPGNIDKVWTVDITPTADGAVTINLPAGAAADAAGNTNIAATQLSRTYDGTGPTVTLATFTVGLLSPTNISPIRILITFNEDVSGFALDDLSVGHGTADNLAVLTANRIWSADVVPIGNEVVTVNLVGGVVTDLAGNINSAANTLSVTYDSVRPTVTFTSSDPNPTNASPIHFNVKFSKLVNGFNLGKLSVGNGTAGNLSMIDRSDYNFTVTPGYDGNVTVNMAEGLVLDDIGNSNTAAAQILRIYDLSSPTVMLTTASSTVGGSFDVTVTFDEPVTGLAAGDFALTNSTVGALTEITVGTVWTVRVNPTGDPVTVILPANSAADLVGNGNVVSNEISVAYDNVAPTVTLTTTASPTTNISPIPVTITFSEKVIGFDSTDLTLVGATLGGFSQTSPGTIWMAYLLPTSPNTGITINLAGGQATDIAGNSNSAATPLSLTYDAVQPTVLGVTSLPSPATYRNNETVQIVVQFSKVVFATGTLQLTLETGITDRIATYTSGSGTTSLTFSYTVQTGDTSANLDYISAAALDLNGGSIRDAVGNNAILTLPVPSAAGSLGFTSNVMIDTQGPLVTNVRSVTANGTYGIGGIIEVEVNFNRNAFVTGTPRLTLATGGAGRPINYTSGDGTPNLLFTYTVQAGDNSTDLDYTNTNALVFNGGTIRDDLTNNAVLTLPAPGAPGSLAANQAIIIDAVAPRVVRVRSTPANTTYSIAGNFFSIQVEFDEVVSLLGAPNSTLLLNVTNANPGGVVASATYLNGAGSNTLNYRYVLRSGDKTTTQPNGSLNYTATNALRANDSVFRDAYGNTSTLALPPTGGVDALITSGIVIVVP